MMLFASIACERDIEIKLDDIEPKLVLYSVFNADETIQVVVSNSRNPLAKGDVVYHKDAVVELFDKNGFIEVLEFVEIENSLGGVGYYSSTHLPLVGEKYLIKASLEGYKDVHAEDIIPLETPIFEAELIADSIPREIGVFSLVNIKLNDPPEENYYNIVFRSKYIDLVSRDTVSDDVVFLQSDDRNIETDLYTGAIFDDASFNGNTKEVSLLYDAFDFGERKLIEITIECRNVSFDYYRYYRTFLAALNSSSDPFAEVVLVHNNIKNGYGLWGGYNKSTKSIDLD